MSAPQRTALAEPGSFPEPDLLLADIIVASVRVDGALLDPERADNDVSGLPAPCLHCYVPPGRRALSRYGDLDEAFVYVGAWGRDYREGADMQRQVRDVLGGYRDGGLWKAIQVHRIREATGPSVIPRSPDAPDELVESGWTVALRRHRGDPVRP